jgi:hypothetical protein
VAARAPRIADRSDDRAARELTRSPPLGGTGDYEYDNAWMRSESRVSAATYSAFDCFLVAGAVGVYLKLALVGPHWSAVARFLGLLSPDDLALPTRLGLFLHDIWINLLAMPLAATLLVTLLFGRFRIAAALVASGVMSVLYFLELQVQKETGDYVSWALVRDFFGWSAAAPGVMLDYASTGSLVKLAAVFLALAAIAIVGRLGARAERLQLSRERQVYRRLLAAPAIIVALAALAALPIAASSPLSASPLGASAVGRAARLLWRTTDAAGVPSDATLESTLAAFRQLTHTPPHDLTAGYVGRESESDVILFVMETGAAQALDLAAVGRDLPGVGRIYPRSFVGARHYTSHPYSSDALYSVFSGRYPHGRRRLLAAAEPGSFDGLMTGLAPSTPMRRVYVPSLYHIELDDRMYEAFGAELVYASDQRQDDALRLAAERRAEAFVAGLEQRGSRFDRRLRSRLRDRLRADLQALEKLKADITEAVRSKRRYAVMFFPEIGHGPWIPLANEGTVLERGRSLMLLQDAWLREVLDLLQTLGRTDRTVVVVTGDHGVRTRAEDPALPSGAISDYMFRVPLIVYAPQTLASPVTIDHPTSHVDLAPTILALAGRSSAAAAMQGIPIWQRLPSQRIYLLAFDYGGAEGYVENGRYYMRQALTGAVYASSQFRFDEASQLPAGDPAALAVDDGLVKLAAMQHVLVDTLLRSRH